MNNCFIEITNKCNLLCKHCFNSSGSIKNEEIALKTLEDIIDKIIDKGVDVITITGGEVQLYSKLNSLIHFIDKHKQQRFHFVTNGTIMNEDFIKFINNNENIWIGISLDGATAETHDAIRGNGSFEKTLEFIERLQTKRCILKFTANKLNMGDVPQFIDFAIKKFFKPEIGCVIDLGRAHQNWESIGLSTSDALSLNRIIEDKAKEYQLDTNELNIGMIHKCKLSCDYPGLFAISIKINGEVMPCGCLQNKIFSIGNIYTDSLNKILHISNKRIALVKKMIDTRKALFQENYCKNCIAFSSRICSKDGGCPAMSEYNFLSPNFVCEYRKTFIMCNYISKNMDFIEKNL